MAKYIVSNWLHIVIRHLDCSGLHMLQLNKKYAHTSDYKLYVTLHSIIVTYVATYMCLNLCKSKINLMLLF